MRSIEVAYDLKDKTEAIIASPTEIVSPGNDGNVIRLPCPVFISRLPNRRDLRNPSSKYGTAKRKIIVQLLSA
ncbi:hypothetical protein [Bacteroides fragilis]|uniref:hypothetical protein n=1 Tax=Bacteroides fragilis TaxID=817 RepID=UPI00202F80B3|nr:hypothetical protein [Bacteroides fragilis]